MARITIEELYRGEKYNIMGTVVSKSLMLDVDEETEDGRTWIEKEIVRQTILAMLKIKQNGDCISDKELGHVVAVFDADVIMKQEGGLSRELGVIALTAMKYALKHRSNAMDIIECVMIFLPYIDERSLDDMSRALFERAAVTDPEKSWINKHWLHLQAQVERELDERRKQQ